ncbi:invasion associated locus B family protein [Ponticaulis sp.]|uniref:invasion associated locus B family protein n=1 Tax=Ponticaulis sp. TaxID=2020902 RepID=UPI000B703194|nr:invasion associated locus B family protein [Ponticaulis sp.]MAI90946.1 hypothetical protein [Ponticaulis sp.]OUX98288.1 MAG: hypothetical protein CBB65_10915 [Hyphomonadaceae bacterium TMED5]|tara:strand:- start:19077 stop:19565 length:489 start_codon:yes stop_codon:yes gene_type:complete
MKRFIAALALATGLAVPAQAFEYVGAFRDWSVYQDVVNGESVCFAATYAEDSAPRNVDHGEVVFFVTYFHNSSLPQASMRTPYEFREDLPARAQVGGSAWTLYTAGNEIFASNDDERAIRDSLRRGSELRVEAVSARDTEVAYHFSLSGSASAIDRAQSLCN